MGGVEDCLLPGRDEGWSLPGAGGYAFDGGGDGHGGLCWPWRSKHRLQRDRQGCGARLGGELASKWVISVAMVGACGCASICLMVTPIWSICEIMGWKKDFDYTPREAPGLYSLQVVGLVLAYLMAVCTDISSTPTWAICAQIVNAALILPVACFLWLLAADDQILPRKYRLQGAYKWALFVVLGIVCLYCVFGTIMTMVSGG